MTHSFPNRRSSDLQGSLALRQTAVSGAERESVKAKIVDFAPRTCARLALDDDTDLHEIVAAPGRRIAAAGARRHERGEGHAQLGPAFLRFDRRGEFACERVDHEEIAAGAAHIAPDACDHARTARTARTTPHGQADPAPPLAPDPTTH